VRIVVKGETTKLVLLPQLPEPPSPFFPGMYAPQMPGTRTIIGGDKPSGSPVEKTLRTFLLNEVVHQANVLLLSSDLSRVKVTRNGLEMQFNLEPPPPVSRPTPPGMPGAPRPMPGPPSPGMAARSTASAVSSTSANLWLRDGDIIEIPERDPNAPPVK
jgi:hypothetical protein